MSTRLQTTNRTAQPGSAQPTPHPKSTQSLIRIVTHQTRTKMKRKTEPSPEERERKRRQHAYAATEQAVLALAKNLDPSFRGRQCPYDEWLAWLHKVHTKRDMPGQLEKAAVQAILAAKRYHPEAEPTWTPVEDFSPTGEEYTPEQEAKLRWAVPTFRLWATLGDPDSLARMQAKALVAEDEAQHFARRMQTVQRSQNKLNDPRTSPKVFARTLEFIEEESEAATQRYTQVLAKCISPTKPTIIKFDLMLSIVAQYLIPELKAKMTGTIIGTTVRSHLDFLQLFHAAANAQ